MCCFRGRLLVVALLVHQTTLITEHDVLTFLKGHPSLDLQEDPSFRPVDLRVDQHRHLTEAHQV
jgi:hypothetical protein